MGSALGLSRSRVLPCQSFGGLFGWLFGWIDSRYRPKRCSTDFALMLRILGASCHLGVIRRAKLVRSVRDGAWVVIGLCGLVRSLLVQR